MAKKYGIDIQKKGSGNIGFANCLRILGWKPAMFVLVGDVLKGFVPVILALKILPLNETLIVALAAILGHIFPVWLQFKGGKGIATGLGITFAINPLIAVLGLVVFLLILLYVKTMSVASILSAWSLSILAYFFSPNLSLFYLSLAALATWTHRENIKRILEGTEKRITR